MGDNGHDEVVRSAEGRGDLFQAVAERAISRRKVLKTSLATAFALGTGGLLSKLEARSESAASSLKFTPIEGSLADRLIVPENYHVEPLLRWGDPIFRDAPEFDPYNQSGKAQEKQFGYNCDFVGFLAFPYGTGKENNGLLVVNHEYTNSELLFPGYDFDAPTQQQVEVEWAAHGVSIVEIAEKNGKWSYNRNSKYNRRLTATAPMEITGPVRGHDSMKTSADPEGERVLGTLNNCSAGKTPWGTVLTAEENFHQYFAHNGKLAEDDPRRRDHDRYGVDEGESERKWERYDARFDISREPHEPYRFGWVVEVDPFDPNSTPKKRTSLGRFRHEAATTVVTKSGKIAMYSGDDAKFEYIYKFVTANAYEPRVREANLDILDEGTLYVAKFNDDGSGEWLPLVYGQGPLTEENGFYSQADVLLNTRRSGDVLGATKMDRPEDIETNPVSGKVYVVLTKNDQRGDDGKADADASNPRRTNKYGHILELMEDGNDHAATKFMWEIFMLCGDPKDESTHFAGYPKEHVSPISCPDNITFDMMGNLWIATDGQPDTLEINDGLFAVPTEGPERGYCRQFFSSVPGAEVCGPEFTPDNTGLFLAIQHPGDGGTFEEPTSRWPDGEGPPRPTVVIVQANDGGRIGTSGNDRKAVLESLSKGLVQALVPGMCVSEKV